MKILIVEDDPGIVDVLDYALRQEGHAVTHAARGNEAVDHASGADFILLDVGLPDIDGFEVCRRIRRTLEVPILFLTSRTDEVDRVVGLEIGGDDYLAKPFSTRELLARIKAIHRRFQSASSPNTGTDQALQIDAEKHLVHFEGRAIDLSPVEFALLTLLASAPGRVFTRNQILDRAWPDGGCVTDLLALSRIESLPASVPVACQINEVAAEVVETFRARAEMLGLTFTSHFDLAAKTASLDAESLRRILTILLDNAFAFTPAGKSVHLETSAHTVIVQDQGCGITPDIQARIFERFFTTTNPLTGRRGTGLGLAIARSLAVRAGGTITLESQPDVGTAVTVMFPTAPTSFP